VFALPGAPDPSVPVVAERTATTLTLARLARAIRAESPQRVAHRSVLATLAGRGYADPAELEARLVALGLPVAARQLVPVVVVPDGEASPGEVADALAAAAADLRIPAIAGPLDDRAAAALLALPLGADPDPALTRLASSLRRTAAQERARHIGVGAACASVLEVRSAFGDASNAANAAVSIATAGASGRPFVHLADLGLAGLVYQLRADPRVLAFAERELRPLLMHDDQHGSDLTAVLMAYLDTGGNKAETAKRCGIARPTLYERLGQIALVLGVSLDDASRRTTLHAALLIRALRSDKAG
jgi:purine catabolism regulator